MSITITHIAYPHIAGYVYDCPACEAACFCGPAVAEGTATPCVFCLTDWDDVELTEALQAESDELADDARNSTLSAYGDNDLDGEYREAAYLADIEG